MAFASSSVDQATSGPVLGLGLYMGTGGLSSALARHADEAYDELDAQQKEVAELIFKRLTEYGDEDGRQTRRPCPLDELSAVAGVDVEAVREVIGHFATRGRSFLTISTDGVVDISHESLIRQWPRLSRWCKEEADSRQSFLRLTDATRRDSALLRNPDLQVATSWHEETQPTPAWAERYGGNLDTALSYLEASQAAEKKRKRLMAAGAVSLAVLAVAFGLLALWATGKQSEAESQAALAVEARQQAEQSQAEAVQAQQDAERERNSAVQAREEAERQEEIAVAAEGTAEDERDNAIAAQAEATELRDLANADTLLAQSQAVRAQNPALALRLAIQASETSPQAQAHALTAFIESNTAFAEQDIQPIGSPIQADDVVNAVEFVNGGTQVASAGKTNEMGEVRVWDPVSSQQVEFDIPAQPTPIRSLASSDEGELLATGANGGAISLWNMDGSMTLGLQMPADADVIALDFGNDDTLASGGSDGIIHVWSLDGAEAPSITIDVEPLDSEGKVAGVRSLTYVADGVLAAAWDNGDFRILYLDETGRAPILFAQPDDSFVDGDRVAMTFDGNARLATAAGQLVQFWDLNESGAPSEATPDNLGDILIGVSTLAFGPDGILAISSVDGEIFLWRNETSELEQIIDSSGARIATISVSPSGVLSSGSQGGVVRLIDLNSARALPRVIDTYLLMTGLDINPATGEVATLGDGNGLENPENDGLWLWGENAESEVNVSPGVVARELDFHPDGTQIVYLERFDPPDPDNPVNNRQGRIWVRELATGETRSVLMPTVGERETNSSGGLTPAADSLAFASNGLVAAAWNAQSVTVWDTNEEDLGTPRSIGNHDERQIEDLAFSPDGSLLVTGGREGLVKVWDTADGGPVAELTTETTAWPRAIEFSRDGSLLVVAKNDGRIFLLDTEDLGGEPAADIVAPEAIRDISISPDAQLLATIAANGTVRIWDLETGLQVIEPLQGSAGSNTLAFSANGSSLLATGRDGLTIWQDLLSIESACEIAQRYVRDAQVEEFLSERAELKGC